LTLAGASATFGLRFSNKVFAGTVKRLALLIVIGLFVQLGFYSPAQAAPEEPVQVKEINFVFIHGAGGNACSMQLLADTIREQISPYILEYEQANPGTEIRFDMLQRCYLDDVDVNTWANNIAASIDEHFYDKENLVLIGHSAGGKAALYAVAHNVGGIADRVVMVVTINSPIKSLDGYYVTGGGSVVDYCRARWLLSDRGICNSIAYYDSSQDGSWVGSNKHWLAFISCESAPASVQFDFGGIDAWPRNMDDSSIPISAQYSDGADVVYYGEHAHSDFTQSDEVARLMTERILRYIFGGSIEYSVFARGGTFEHKANWLPGKDHWEDIVGEVLVKSGRLEHMNESYFRWQTWEDVVGKSPTAGERSSYRVSLLNPFFFFTGIRESHWLNQDSEDYRLYLRTWAAPRNRVQVDWSIYRQELLPTGTERDHYEVEIATGTPLTGITYVSWIAKDPRDLRALVWSEAESPFRWFQAEWRVYFKEVRQRKVIDEIPAKFSL
jgi:pimeloyl-ACP methyl ester carboxylesterase